LAAPSPPARSARPASGGRPGSLAADRAAFAIDRGARSCVWFASWPSARTPAAARASARTGTPPATCGAGPTPTCAGQKRPAEPEYPAARSPRAHRGRGA
ncbi:hypothetical protein, partial [Corynebacterium sp. ACRPF]|uniref:hypothetical protein n=1 Tax=Corynebacterium sp. ACRPF TaxID=2918197 RepID=UPI001EF2FCEF